MEDTDKDDPLTVVVISQDELFYLPYFFERFLERVDEPVHIRNVYLTAPFDEGILDLTSRGLQLYGYLGFLRRGSDYVMRKIGANVGLYDSVANLLREHSIPVTHTDDVNADETVEAIRALHPDVLLSVSAAQVFSPELLDTPSWGALNVHSARLPEYRGMMPNFWAMYHGDDTAGITVHTMEEEIDRGKIVLQDEISIREDDTLDTLIKRSKKHGADLVLDALEQIHEGTVDTREMTGPGSYYSFPSADDVQEFRERGNRLI